jgi:16S rRNA (cytosine1402-N4)-methyltransferase
MMVAARPHVPVLGDRIAALFRDAPDGVVVDGTVGAGGHAAAIARARLDRYGSARIVGIDRDPHALALADETLRGLGPEVEVSLVRARFDELAPRLDALGVGQVAGILLDLGLSSMQLDDASRGFAYRTDAPLDMRMDPDLPTTAADLVNGLEPDALARILRELGEERFADRIARRIVDARPIDSTVALAEVVRDAIPAATRRTGGHPATRTFQALRIAVNGELEALERVLPAAIDRLVPGGVLAVLSYHSLEDRRVKQAMASATSGCVCPPDLPVCACGRTPIAEHLIRRPTRPAGDEVAANPRARSARLRAIRRLEAGAR